MPISEFRRNEIEVEKRIWNSPDQGVRVKAQSANALPCRVLHRNSPTDSVVADAKSTQISKQGVLQGQRSREAVSAHVEQCDTAPISVRRWQRAIKKLS